MRDCVRHRLFPCGMATRLVRYGNWLVLDAKGTFSVDPRDAASDRYAIEHRRPQGGGSIRMALSGEYEPSTATWARENAERYMASGGTEGTDVDGRPVILLTTIGARSGKLRKTPLMRIEHNGEYAIVASLAGSDQHPAWYYNVKSNPHVELQDRLRANEYHAREVFGQERALWWRRAVQAWPDYAKYQAMTARQIPVFVLTAIDQQHADASS